MRRPDDPELRRRQRTGELFHSKNLFLRSQITPVEDEDVRRLDLVTKERALARRRLPTSCCGSRSVITGLTSNAVRPARAAQEVDELGRPREPRRLEDEARGRHEVARPPRARPRDRPSPCSTRSRPAPPGGCSSRSPTGARRPRRASRTRSRRPRSARDRPGGARRSLTAVVFPAPRNPERTWTGTFTGVILPPKFSTPSGLPCVRFARCRATPHLPRARRPRSPRASASPRSSPTPRSSTASRTGARASSPSPTTATSSSTRRGEPPLRGPQGRHRRRRAARHLDAGRDPLPADPRRRRQGAERGLPPRDQGVRLRRRLSRRLPDQGEPEEDRREARSSSPAASTATASRPGASPSSSRRSRRTSARTASSRRTATRTTRSSGSR